MSKKTDFVPKDLQPVSHLVCHRMKFKAARAHVQGDVQEEVEQIHEDRRNREQMGLPAE